MTRSDLQQNAELFIRNSLRKHLPREAKVYLFGSRARQTAPWNADYDLWIDAELPEATLHAILEDLDESFVPFKLDLVTTAQLRGHFAEQVKSEAIRWM